jgi:O-antigen ligase
VTWMRGSPIVFVVMGCMLLGWFFSNIEKNLLKTPTDKYYALFFILFVVSTINAGWLSYTAETVTETLKIALIYWFIVTIVDNESKFKTAIWTTIVFMTVVALMGILQFYGYDITGSGIIWAPDKEVWQIRGAGMFDNPNDLAYSVVLVVPYALGLLLLSGNPLIKVAAMTMLGASVYCIYLTKSRGGYLALIICLVSWLYYWLSNEKIRRVALIAGFIGIIAAFSVQTKDYRNDASSMGRVEAWDAGMQMLMAHPFIGVGKNQFIEHHNRDSHNSFVRAGADLGFIGLFAFVGILSSTFRSVSSLNLDYSRSEWKNYRIGLLSYLWSYVVASIFSTRTYDIVFMVVIAFAGSLIRLVLNDSVNAELNVLVNENIINIKVISITILILTVWKLFLIQVW